MAAAAHAAVSLGQLDQAEQFATGAMALVADHDDTVVQKCGFTRGIICLLRGRLDQARRELVTAAHGEYWRSVATSTAALCAAYSGDLHEANRLNASIDGIAAAPSARAYWHYVTAEIDALAGSWDTAEEHYRQAIELTLPVNAAFVHGVASVGLVVLYAARGQVRQALLGYSDLVDHWERTGGWPQQWTTLRNAADLFDQLGDHQLASTLRHAADRAPEAASIGGPTTPDLAAARHTAHTDRVADGPTHTRDEILHLTRQAITHWLATTTT
jgi:tetratricopeptide (TPR) repeat protein